MSNQYYQNLWKEAINDLLENYELENYPLDQAIQSVPSLSLDRLESLPGQRAFV